MNDATRVDMALVLPGRWDGSLLEPLAEINAQLLEALMHAAAQGAHAQGLQGPLLVRELRAEWLRLTPDACRRMAACPYLLLDAGFAMPELWSERLVPGVRDQQPQSGGELELPLASALVRRALVLAWHLARSNPLAARISFGMSEHCTALIAATRLHDLDLLAELRPDWIRPRWADRPEIWRGLLRASLVEREAPLRQLQLRGLQLLAAGLRA